MPHSTTQLCFLRLWDFASFNPSVQSKLSPSACWLQEIWSVSRSFAEGSTAPPMQAAFCQTLLLSNMKFSLVAEGCILGAAKMPAGYGSKRRTPRVGSSGILLHSLLTVRKREQEAPGFFAHCSWRHVLSSGLCRTQKQRRKKLNVFWSCYDTAQVVPQGISPQQEERDAAMAVPCPS